MAKPHPKADAVAPVVGVALAAATEARKAGQAQDFALEAKLSRLEYLAGALRAHLVILGDVPPAVAAALLGLQDRL